jgi:2-dehydro-3-deoxygalactonokinase
VAFITVDSGTTHSRVYVIGDEKTVLGRAQVKAGVRDTAITGSRETLQKGIREAFDAAVEEAGIEPHAVRFAMASGMITSEIGLMEIPHLWAPAGVDDLAANLERVRDTHVFPLDMPVYFVRGIKNAYDPQTVTAEDVGTLDFMRGEEAQVAGILASGQHTPPFVVAVLSSHTKFVPVDGAGRVLGSVTTLSGQVYEAIRTETSIAKSIKPPEGEEDEYEDYWDESVVENGFRWAGEAGLSRTFLMARFLDTLVKRPWYEARLFVQSAIAAEDARALEQVTALMPAADTGRLVFVGARSRNRLYRSLMQYLGREVRIDTIEDPADIDFLSISGVISIAERAGILEKGGTE